MVHEMAIILHNVREIFNDYSARRTAILRALTTEVDQFCQLCDPAKENLCLYGHPNESWEVSAPPEEAPTELPEPLPGINFSRDGMNRKEWLYLIAVHSDSWLLSVAFYLGAHLNRRQRSCLFSMINDLPTIFEVVTGRKPVQGKPRMDRRSKSPGNTKRSIDGQVEINPKPADDSHEKAEDEQTESLCGCCGIKYNIDEFWIACDVCDRWFHGECVKITPSEAESIQQYECPFCSMKRKVAVD